MAAHVSGMVAVMKIAVLKSSCSEKNVIKKIAIPIDNLNWKVASEGELLRITTILEPIVKAYEECLWVIQKPSNYW